jgi:hypothetical protein
VPNCNYMVPPKARRVKENVLYHIRAARKTEKHASLRPHWEFDFARTGYATRIAQADLQCLTPEQRAKRRTDSRKENQRRRRQKSKHQAEVGAAALGDASLYPRLDKTSEYRRKAAEKHRVDEHYKFPPTHSLLASGEMGGLFCFYLHFSLGVVVSEDLDQQPDRVATIILGLRDTFPNDDGERLRTVGLPWS